MGSAPIWGGVHRVPLVVRLGRSLTKKGARLGRRPQALPSCSPAGKEAPGTDVDHSSARPIPGDGPGPLNLTMTWAALSELSRSGTVTSAGRASCSGMLSLQKQDLFQGLAQSLSAEKWASGWGGSMVQWGGWGRGCLASISVFTGSKFQMVLSFLMILKKACHKPKVLKMLSRIPYCKCKDGSLLHFKEFGGRFFISRAALYFKLLFLMV